MKLKRPLQHKSLYEKLKKSTCKRIDIIKLDARKEGGMLINSWFLGISLIQTQSASQKSSFGRKSDSKECSQ